jgi:serine/threonine protein kinase
MCRWVGIGVMQKLQPGDPQFIGPYRLLGQLGSGGMGRVFLGLSAGGRRVAVKVIRSELAADPEFRVRFRREVAIARTVSGMFTAVVVDADVDAPAPWLATAYVAGPSLAQAVEAHGRLPAGSVLALAAGLAESLATIHAAGLVHRDLKPSNVLLGEDGPRVIDFGISRAVEATSLTGTGLVVGSPGFMSPEQAEGGVIGAPSDMFSLGAVLAFAATGEGPFGSGSTPALIYRVVHGAPDLEQVPAVVRPLVERCLAKDPADRPAAADFLAQIGSVQPVTGWLPEAVIRTVPEDPASAAAAVSGQPEPGPAKDSQPTGSPPAPVHTVTAGQQPPSSRPPRPGRGSRFRRRRRALVLACGALLAVSAAAVLTLNAGSGSQPASQPAITSPDVSASASTSPSVTQPAGTSPAVTPASPYRYQLEGARPYSCSDEGSAYSPASTSKVLFTFINNTAARLEITWLDFNGKRQLYDVLSPGNSFSVDTYIGHYWLIASSRARCLSILAVNGSGHIVIKLP